MNRKKTARDWRSVPRSSGIPSPETLSELSNGKLSKCTSTSGHTRIDISWLLRMPESGFEILILAVRPMIRSPDSDPSLKSWSGGPVIACCYNPSDHAPITQTSSLAWAIGCNQSALGLLGQARNFQ
jgi:hypothetical protein